jgi:hypothetical protein
MFMILMCTGVVLYVVPLTGSHSPVFLKAVSMDAMVKVEDNTRTHQGIEGTKKTTHLYIGDQWDSNSVWDSRYIWLPVQTRLRPRTA